MDNIKEMVELENRYFLPLRTLHYMVEEGMYDKKLLIDILEDLSNMLEELKDG